MRKAPLQPYSPSQACSTASARAAPAARYAPQALAGRAGAWHYATVTGAPKVNRDRLRLLTGAAGVVLGPDHPTTQALARAITTWGGEDVKRARAHVRQLDLSMRVFLDDLARRAGARV